MKKLRICHCYEKMTPEELAEAIKSFSGLSGQALEALNRVMQILLKQASPPVLPETKGGFGYSERSSG